MEALKDADVLRVLQLHLSGLGRQDILRQTQLDAFTVQRIVHGKKTLRTKRVIEKYPEWRAKNEHLVEELNLNASKKNEDSTMGEYEAKRLQRMRENQAAMAALGMHKLRTKREARTEPTKAALAKEAARQNPRRSSRLSAVTKPWRNGGGGSRMDLSALALTREEQDVLMEALRESEQAQGQKAVANAQKQDLGAL